MKINIHNLLGENQRLKIVGQDGAVITPPETVVNPTLDVTGNTLSVCLAPAVTEEFPDDPLMFHISSLDESSGWFQVEFWDVPIGSKLMIDWGDGSPIEEIISDSNNDGYLTPYHYYTSVDHVAKFAIDQPIGGWVTQSANIDSVVSFGSAVQAGYIEIHKAYKLISVPAMLPEYINGIEIDACNLLNDSNISLWDTSHITTMINMFNGCPLFNQPLNTWDVSKVTNMSNMFRGATAFNQDLSMWCVPLITSKPVNFASLSPLTPEHMPVWGTCPSEITEPTLLSFRVASPDYSGYFEVSDYTLSDGTSMEVDWGDGSPVETYVKGGQKPYHDYAAGTDCVCTFKLNQPVEMVWFWSDVVTEIISFGDTPIANPKFGFNVLNKVPETLPTYVTSCQEMFYCSYGFNAPEVSNWDVSHVTKMGDMFGLCYPFNQPLNNWDVSNVTEMWHMFGECREFNQPLNQWNVSQVTNMYQMFYKATIFNQDLSSWCVANITSQPSGFATDSALTEDKLPVWGTCPSGV